MKQIQNQNYQMFKIDIFVGTKSSLEYLKSFVLYYLTKEENC